MAPRWTRFVRGWLTAGFSVVVAAFSHVAGGGAEPGALGVVLALAFSVPLCIALTGRRASLLRLAVSVAASQLAFHVLFSLGAGSAGGPGASSTGGHHSPLVVTAGASDLLATAGGHQMAMVGGSMWAAHATAALVTVVGLRWGAHCLERLALVAAQGLARVRRVLSGTPVPVSPGPRLRPVLALPGRRAPPLRAIGARPLRGPPLPV
jgi:hypothetical protein